MRPLLSICIPTYNRADLLDYCLTNLAALKDCGKPIEVVISDNGSTDRTPDIVEAHRGRIPNLRLHRFPENRGAVANRLNVLRKAEGEFVTYLADDDTLLIDNLFHHVETLETQKDLVAIYADWIAWNDQEERELHRHYESVKEFVSFGADAPLDLLNFMLRQFLPPEIGVYRRELLVRVQAFHGRSLAYYMLMYRLSRLGRIAFDPLPFYREHRILKDRFQRTHWANMDAQFSMIGEELRFALEAMVLMAVQDAGAPSLPREQAIVAQDSINRILHSRLRLEIDRACGRADWITGVELRRRLVLWYGPGTADDTQNDVLALVIPAALQGIQQTYRSLSDVSGLSLRGFESERLPEFYKRFFPDTPLLPPGTAANGKGAPLIVHRDAKTLAQDRSIEDPTSVLVLEQLAELYRVTAVKVDLSEI